MLQRMSNTLVRGFGFSVNVPDIHIVEYCEGQRRLTIEIEGGTTKQGRIQWSVYTQTFSGWLPPHNQEEISTEARKRILRNVSESLSLLGMSHDPI